MATYYYDLSAGSNGTGTTASPFNGSVWPGAALVAGDSHLFKRGSSRSFSFTIDTSGSSSSSMIKFGTYYNADGTDDTTQAKPVITTTVQCMAFGAPKDYIWLDGLSISATGMGVANDKSWVFLGTGCKVTNCIIDSNCGCIGVWDKDSVVIAFNTLKGVSHSSANNNQPLAVVNSASHSGYEIYNNTVTHYGGGGTTSHAMACYDTDGTSTMVNLVIRNNVVSTSTGTYNANTSAIGIRILNGGSASVENNTVTYHQVGIFCAGGAGTMTGAHIIGNVCNYNYHFGIALTTATHNFTIDSNTCNFNGTSTVDSVLQGYGRGIELSSAAGQGSCSDHTISLNICKGNYNYGGPSDNASEGVGIGIDDGATSCLVAGNTCTDNEGNGVQCYGGGNNATWTNTRVWVVANLFKNNCAANILNRRSGGTVRSGHFNADVALSYTHGAGSLVANNTHAGGTVVGVSTDGNCDNIQYGNNIFIFTPYPYTTALTPAANDYRNTIFRAPTQKYSGTDVDGNGAATFPAIVYSGNIDYVTNHGLDSNYEISGTGANSYRLGVQYIVTGFPTTYSVNGSALFVDRKRRSYNVVSLAPSIGCHEYSDAGGTGHFH